MAFVVLKLWLGAISSQGTTAGVSTRLQISPHLSQLLGIVFWGGKGSRITLTSTRPVVILSKKKEPNGINVGMHISIHLATVQVLVVDFKINTEISRLYQTRYQRILIRYPIKVMKYRPSVPSVRVC